MERKLPNSKRREISFTRDWPSRGNKPRRIVVNRSKTWPWVVKNDTRENSARILRPGIIQDHIEREQVPNGEGQRSMVSCFTVIRSRDSNDFSWWNCGGRYTDRSVFANVFVNLFVMDLEGAIFYFLFFFVAPINWCFCISSASYDVDI